MWHSIHCLDSSFVPHSKSLPFLLPFQSLRFGRVQLAESERAQHGQAVLVAVDTMDTMLSMSGRTAPDTDIPNMSGHNTAHSRQWPVQWAHCNIASNTRTENADTHCSEYPTPMLLLLLLPLMPMPLPLRGEDIPQSTDCTVEAHWWHGQEAGHKMVGDHGDDDEAVHNESAQGELAEDGLMHFRADKSSPFPSYSPLSASTDTPHCTAVCSSHSHETSGDTDCGPDTYPFQSRPFYALCWRT